MRKIIAFVLFAAFTVMLIPWISPAGAVDQDTTVKVYDQQENLVKSVVFKIGVPRYVVNNQTPGVEMDAAPFIQKDRTFVPVRFLGNALGVTDSNITWDSDSQTATLTLVNTLSMRIGSPQIMINGIADKIDVAPLIINPGRTMLPARYVAEGLGYQVDWDEATQTVLCWPMGEDKPAVAKAIEWLQEVVNEKEVIPALPVTPPQKELNVSPKTVKLTGEDIERIKECEPTGHCYRPEYPHEQTLSDKQRKELLEMTFNAFNPGNLPCKAINPYFPNTPQDMFERYSDILSDDHKLSSLKGAKLEWISNLDLAYVTRIGHIFISGVMRVTFDGENKFELIPGQAYERDTGFDITYGNNKEFPDLHWEIREMIPFSEFKPVE